MAYADQKAYLVSEIEKMKAELVAESAEEGFQNMQNEFKSVQLDILNEQAQLMTELLNGKKNEGDEVEQSLRYYNSYLDDSTRLTAVNIRELENGEISKLEREQNDLETDLSRLDKLSAKYGPTTRELLQNSADFEKA